MDIQSNGFGAEATQNTEMILIADVDTNLLKELRSIGWVRNLKTGEKACTI